MDLLAHAADDGSRLEPFTSNVTRDSFAFVHCRQMGASNGLTEAPFEGVVDPASPEGAPLALTAFQLGHRVLYHWQRLDADRPELATRLSTFLKTKRLYCSSPGAFNDPWDCRPHFNTELLQDRRELRKRADWAVDVCNRRKPMSPGDTARMHHTLLNDVPYATRLLVQMSEDLAPAINQRYRVYCLGPDPTNVLMWSHYSGDHRGICLEFSLRNEVTCCALECEYLAEFAMMGPYHMSEEEELRVLLAKSDVWSYEKEFRLVAQERSQAIRGADTLMTDDSFLQLPANALTAIIVGCQGDYNQVKNIVDASDPSVKVKRAVRVPNRYRLLVEE